MGRLPAEFAGCKITARQPQSFNGELALTSAQQGQQLPDSTYLNNTDRPFEIHRMIPFCVAQDSSGVALPGVVDQELLLALVRIKISDLAKGPTSFMKASTRIRALLKGTSELTWEFADPYYLAKSEQLQVILDSLTFPAITVDDVAIAQILVTITFEGFFITIGPPSDNR